MTENWKVLMKDFVKYEDVEEEVIEKYKNYVSDKIIELWKEYGYGYFRDGFIKIINPDEYQEVFDTVYDNVNNYVPIFVTGMADILAYNTKGDDSFLLYSTRYGKVRFLPNGFEGMSTLLGNNFLIKEFFSYLPFKEAIEKYGIPQYDECFGYTPLLSLGGYEDISHLEKVDLMAHLQIIATLQEPFDWDNYEDEDD